MYTRTKILGVDAVTDTFLGADGVTDAFLSADGVTAVLESTWHTIVTLVSHAVVNKTCTLH